MRSERMQVAKLLEDVKGGSPLPKPLYSREEGSRRLRGLAVSPVSTATDEYGGDSVDEMIRAKAASMKKKRRIRQKEQNRRFNCWVVRRTLPRRQLRRHPV